LRLAQYFQRRYFFNFIPLFSILSLAAILVRNRDHRTQIWKGATQGSYHQSLVAIGPVVSEEKIKMWNVDERRKPLNQIKPNLAWMVPGWVPYKIVSDSPDLHSRWLLLLNI
jgi:hypothetical protein